MTEELRKIDWTGYQSYVATKDLEDIIELCNNHVDLGTSLIGLPGFQDFAAQREIILKAYQNAPRELEFRLYQHLILFLVTGGQLEYNRETGQWDFVQFEIPELFLEGAENMRSNL